VLTAANLADALAADVALLAELLLLLLAELLSLLVGL
jgi:hypothetical protein